MRDSLDVSQLLIAWPEAVRDAVRRVTLGRTDGLFTRQELLERELQTIQMQTQTTGKTPDQTLSRVLQQLRDNGEIEFVSKKKGVYRSRLVKHLSYIDVEAALLTESEMDDAILARRLRLGVVDAKSDVAISRRRMGQQRIRELTLELYNGKCALCEINEPSLLGASHIVPWALDECARGRLDNVICLCCFHDALFERGWWSLSDKLEIIRASRNMPSTIVAVMSTATTFHEPHAWSPAPEYIRRHRELHGL